MKTKLVMTLLARDEEDIVEHNICFHLNSGVDFIVARDNGSTDNTPKIFEKYKRLGVLDYKIIPEHTYEQAKWVSEMARDAVDNYGATHLIHADADEFFFNNSGNLKIKLPMQDEVLLCPRINYIPFFKISNDWKFSDFRYCTLPNSSDVRQDDIKKNPLLVCNPYKIISSSLYTNVVAGNHDVCSEKANPRESLEYFVHHFPYRSYLQFVKRVKKSGEAMTRCPISNQDYNWHIRSQYSEYLKNSGKITGLYRDIILTDHIQLLIASGNIKPIRVSKRIVFAKSLFNFRKIFRNIN